MIRRVEVLPTAGLGDLVLAAPLVAALRAAELAYSGAAGPRMRRPPRPSFAVCLRPSSIPAPFVALPTAIIRPGGAGRRGSGGWWRKECPGRPG
ncbi:MAG: hypothetical protein ACRD44_04325 [Bryobacteraceae bacterium]